MASPVEMFGLLPWRPKPQSDELLSSWLCRVAAGNSPKLHSFCELFWPGLQIWTRDIDALAHVGFINTLAKITGTTSAEAHRTSLRTLCGIVYDRVHVVNATPWVLPLGIYHRTRLRHGQQWCPHCLQEDEMPYYRMNWRLAFSTTCSIHGTLLADRCLECGSPAVPHRKDPLKCHICGLDRRHNSPAIADSQTIQLEHRMRQIACDPKAPCCDLGCHHPLAYFRLIKQVLSIVSSNPRAARLRKATCDAFGGDPSPPLFRGRLPMAEALPVEERHRMIAIVARLLEGWPFKFVAMCAESGMSKSWANRGDSATLPYAYVREVQRYLSLQEPYS